MDYLDYNRRIEQISGYLENDVKPIRMSVKYLDQNDIKGSASKIRIALESLLKKTLSELEYKPDDFLSKPLGNLKDPLIKADNDFFNEIGTHYEIIRIVGNQGSHEDKSSKKTELNIAHCFSALESLFYIISIYIKKYKNPDFEFEKDLSSDYGNQIFNLAIKTQSGIYRQAFTWNFESIFFAPSITNLIFDNIKNKFKEEDPFASTLSKKKLRKGLSWLDLELPLLAYKYSFWSFSKGFLLTNKELRGSEGFRIAAIDISTFEIRDNLIWVNNKELAIFKEEEAYLSSYYGGKKIKLSDVLFLFFEELIRINSLAKEHKPITINLNMNSLFYRK